MMVVFVVADAVNVPVLLALKFANYVTIFYL